MEVKLSNIDANAEKKEYIPVVTTPNRFNFQKNILVRCFHLRIMLGKNSKATSLTSYVKNSESYTINDNGIYFTII